MNEDCVRAPVERTVMPKNPKQGDVAIMTRQSYTHKCSCIYKHKVSFSGAAWVYGNDRWCGHGCFGELIAVEIAA